VLVEVIQNGLGDSAALGNAVVVFMKGVGKGFSPSGFGDAMIHEIQSGCSARRKGKAAVIQGLARFLLEEPDHRGVSKLLRELSVLATTHGQFSDVKVDRNREFWDAVRLAEFDDVNIALTEMANRRVYSRPRPPDKAISNIYKAKGLECDRVLLMPCDGTTFPDKPDARCLLYVALSRAKRGLMLVVSQTNPSPLLIA
jgi:DNA helicase-2/ATP-dependent DNA helicase PcrA